MLTRGMSLWLLGPAVSFLFILQDTSLIPKPHHHGVCTLEESNLWWLRALQFLPIGLGDETLAYPKLYQIQNQPSLATLTFTYSYPTRKLYNQVEYVTSDVYGSVLKIKWPTGANKLFLGYCLQR